MLLESKQSTELSEKRQRQYSLLSFMFGGLSVGLWLFSTYAASANNVLREVALYSAVVFASVGGALRVMLNAGIEIWRKKQKSKRE